MFRSLLRFFTLLVAIGAAGCDTHDQQQQFDEDASRPPDNIVNTDRTGKIITDDPDDWRIAPLFAGKVRVVPAYPNPVSAEFVTIPFSVLDFNAIRGGLVLRGFDAGGRFILLDEERGATQPGSYIFSFSPSLLGRIGLHRVYVFDGFGEIVSYGDIQVQ